MMPIIKLLAAMLLGSGALAYSTVTASAGGGVRIKRTGDQYWASSLTLTAPTEVFDVNNADGDDATVSGRRGWILELPSHLVPLLLSVFSAACAAHG